MPKVLVKKFKPSRDLTDITHNMILQSIDQYQVEEIIFSSRFSNKALIRNW